MIDARRTRMPGARLMACSLLACLTIAGGGRTAAAQQIEGGATTEVATFFVRGVDTAFDPSTNSYLVVGGAGPLVGVCVNAAGVPISGLMTVNPEGYGSFPRAAYSPVIGGFLVAWAEEVGSPSEIHARTVRCSGALGAEQVISGGHSAWLESGPAVAYSATSGRFMVVWKSFPTAAAPIRVKGVLVDNNGTAVSGVIDISPGFGRDPGVAWNPTTDQFGVSFSGESGTSNFSGFAVVPASNPAAFSRVTFNFFSGGMATITDVTYNAATNRYLMSWFEISTGFFSKVAEFDAAGNLLTSGIASLRVGSYDALSIAYNPVSRTSLLGGVDRANDAMIGIELNSRGFPFNGENTLSATHRSSFYERVSSSTLAKSWLGAFSARLFNGIAVVPVTSFASAGGPGGSYDASAPAPTPPPPSGGCTTIQPGPGWVCVDGGWRPPSDTPPPPPPPPPPPTGGCTTIQPGPGWVCVDGGWLPPGVAPAPAPPPPPPPPTGCTTIQPGPGWVCVDGGWLPPGVVPVPAPPPPPPPSTSCTTISPGPGWVCVGGGWLPPGSPLIPPPPPPPSSCTTISPGPGWVCVDGGWLPPGSPLIPPALPPPPTSSCTTVQPGPGWICSGGGWLPPDMACPTISPGPGWTCVGGGWLPPGYPGT
jgi:hypothetical protein